MENTLENQENNTKTNFFEVITKHGDFEMEVKGKYPQTEENFNPLLAIFKHALSQHIQPQSPDSDEAYDALVEKYNELIAYCNELKTENQLLKNTKNATRKDTLGDNMKITC